MRTMLIRHAQVPSNIIRALDTAVPGPSLTDLGHQQALAVAQQVGHEPIQAIYASTMLRTQQTARPLASAQNLPVQVRPGLEEIDAGQYRMRNDLPAIEEYLQAAFAWSTGDLEQSVPGGETGTTALGRFDQAISNILADGHETVAVFSHGAMIRAWTAARVHNASVKMIAANGLVNTGVVILDIVAGQPPTLVSWQDYAAPLDAGATQ